MIKLLWTAGSGIGEMIRLFQVSFIYFLIVFAFGFLFGSLRVLSAVDIVGERAAELAEMPMMALVCALSARYLVVRHGHAFSASKTLGIGLLALLMLLLVEFAVVLALRGLTIAEYFSTRDPVTGAAYVMGLVWYALAPWLFYRAGASRVAKFNSRTRTV